MTRLRFNRLVVGCVGGAAAVLVAVGPQRVAVEAQGTSGAIVGHVRLTAPAPPSPVIRMGGDPKCSAAAGGKRESFLDGVMGDFLAGCVHGQVVVRADRERNTPPGHGHLGIEFRGATERAFGFVVIEGVDQTEALVEKLLCFGTGSLDGMMMVTQAVDERG